MGHNAEKSIPEVRGPAGAQTLLRGLDVLEGVAAGPLPLAELAAKLGLSRSTTHRLANSLIDRRYLVHVPNQGYKLGPKLLELGFLTQQQTEIVQLARPWLQLLSEQSEDTVHLGIRDGDRALYLDKIPGSRRISIRSRVGDRHPLTSTGLGKALLLDESAEEWEQIFRTEQAGKSRDSYAVWLDRMRHYVERGRSYDLEENEDQIRCVAAPIRDVTGAIVAAISVSSAAQYMDDRRMEALTADVVKTATSISRGLGWQERAAGAPTRTKAAKTA
jgi:DNA-binding IclR family transcriptional regulator